MSKVAVLTTDGRLEIPAEIRRSLHLVGGERFEVFPLGEGSIELRRAERPTLDDLFALRVPVKGCLSVEAIDEAIGAAVVESFNASVAK